MMPRAGLLLHDHRLTLVARTGRRRLEHLTFELDENPSALLKAELDSRRIRLRGLRIGLQRALVTVKALELPPGVGGDQRQMVGFELERHVPFPPEDVVFDFLRLSGQPSAEGRVLVAACERRTLERALRLLEAPKLRPLSVTVATHDLPVLLRRGAKTRRVVWAHRLGDSIDLLFIEGGQLRLSRTVPAGDGESLAAEIAGSLPLVKWRDCEAVWVSGDESERLLSSRGGEALGVPVLEPPYSPAAEALISALPPEEPGASLLALAAAAGSRQPPLNLLPRELRPQTVSVGQAVTAGMLVLAIALGVAVPIAQSHRDRRYLDQLTVAIRGLEPEVKAVEALAAELQQKKRLLDTLESIRQSGLRPLPVLRELTEIVPQEAWLNTLNMDLRGVEVSGQASAANQLIPLLENSPSLERVEFTAPVTKGRDKEQFRIKAVWEPRAAPRSVPTPPASERPAIDRQGREPRPPGATPFRVTPVPGPLTRPPAPG